MAFLDETGLAELWTLVKAEDAKGLKIATGSYTGTGTAGEDNPCVLNFGFRPIVFFLDVTTARTDAKHYCWCYPQMESKHTSGYVGVDILWLDDGISWYVDSGFSQETAENQFNTEGKEYHYVAIGV